MITTSLPLAAEQRAQADRARARARDALDRAVESLLSRQHHDGWWQDGPHAQITTVTTDLLTRDLLGLRAPGHAALAARLIRPRQRDDGSWAQFPAGPPDPAATAACYVALRLAGDSADAYHMALAAGWLREAGGLRCADLVTMLWLGHAGLYTWPYPPVAPPELLLLPEVGVRRPPPDAARATSITVPLAVIGLPRPTSGQQPFDLDEIAPSAAAGGPERAPGHGPGRIGRAVGTWPEVDPALPPLRQVRALANRRCAAWMLARQAPDGSWDQCAEITALTLVALARAGFCTGHRAMARGLSWLDWQAGCSRNEWLAGQVGVGEREGATPATARGTEAARAALVAAGLPAGHPALTRATAFLDCHPVPLRYRVNGARPAPMPGAAPGESRAAVVAQAVTELSARGFAAVRQARGAVVWLLRDQAADGSWAASDGRPDVMVTAAVLRALIAAGVRPGKEPIRRAARWLAGQQVNGSDTPGGGGSGPPSGGWPAVAGVAAVPTVSATASAVLALIACGDGESARSAQQGVEWLIAAQRDDGNWDDAPVVGSTPAGVPPGWDGRGGGAEPGGPYLFPTCRAVEALSGFLRFTAESATVGGKVAR